jgi:hypothetical protein
MQQNCTYTFTADETLIQKLKININCTDYDAIQKEQYTKSYLIESKSTDNGKSSPSKSTRFDFNISAFSRKRDTKLEEDRKSSQTFSSMYSITRAPEERGRHQRTTSCQSMKEDPRIRPKPYKSRPGIPFDMGPTTETPDQQSSSTTHTSSTAHRSLKYGGSYTQNTNYMGEVEGMPNTPPLISVKGHSTSSPGLLDLKLSEYELSTIPEKGSVGSRKTSLTAVLSELKIKAANTSLLNTSPNNSMTKSSHNSFKLVLSQMHFTYRSKSNDSELLKSAGLVEPNNRPRNLQLNISEVGFPHSSIRSKKAARRGSVDFERRDLRIFKESSIDRFNGSSPVKKPSLMQGIFKKQDEFMADGSIPTNQIWSRHWVVLNGNSLSLYPCDSEATRETSNSKGSNLNLRSVKLKKSLGDLFQSKSSVSNLASMNLQGGLSKSPIKKSFGDLFSSSTKVSATNENTAPSLSLSISKSRVKRSLGDLFSPLKAESLENAVSVIYVNPVIRRISTG